MISLRILPQTRRMLTVLTVATGLVFAQPIRAAEEYPAPGFFLDGLSDGSSWSEVQAKPGVKVDFPFVAFESTYVPLSSVCVDGAMLAISDPRMDTGARVSADTLRAQVEAAAAAGGEIAPPRSPLASAAVASDQPSPVAMRFPVKVYKVTERGILREWVYLFTKPWPIPACPAK
jgi:hypothetical protein